MMADSRWLLTIIVGFLMLGPSQTQAQELTRKEFDSTHWRDRIDKFKAEDQLNPPPKGAILFVGSSTIVRWDNEALFPESQTINRGFGGSTIPNVLAYMDEIVIPYKPSIIVFYSGDNDVNRGQLPRYVAEDFQAFTDRVHAELPETIIILLPIKPSVSRWEKWPAMSSANALMADVCARNSRLIYLDLVDTVLDDKGQPDPEAFSDGLHLDAPIYRIWSDRVKGALAAIKGMDTQSTQEQSRTNKGS